MNANDLKRYISEFIIGILLLGLILTIYLAIQSYIEMSLAEEKIISLEQDIDKAKKQITKYSEISDQDRKKWKGVINKFLDTFPTTSSLPGQISYDAIKKSFQGVDIPVESVALYEMLYKITRLTGIQKIDIRKKETASVFKDDTISEFLDAHLLEVSFASQYSTIFRFIKELRQLPLVLEVSNLALTAHEGLINVRMTVHYFVRKNENPCPAI